MKTFAKFIAISGLMYASNSFGLQAIDATEKPIPSSESCEKIVSMIIYGENAHQLSTQLTTDDKDYIISNLSSVTVYNPGDKVFIDGEFTQPSNYAPKNGTYVTAWQNGKTKLNIKSLVDSDRDKVVGQVRFAIRRIPAGENGLEPKINLVSTVSSKDQPLKLIRTDHGPNTRRFDANMVASSTDCLNILPRWCGDGVIDVSEGEICDDGGKNGLPGQCSALCKK